MTDGRPIIAKTGTTNTAQSAFFIGAIPQESLAIGIFTNHQSGLPNDPQTLNGLGGISQGFGGTWPAMIWHAYAENMFLPQAIEQFQPAAFTGAKWTLVPPGLLKSNHPKKKHGDQNPNPGATIPSGPGGGPNPYPTYSCDPSVVTCNPNAPGGNGGDSGTGGGQQSVSTVQAGAAVGGVFAGLPAASLWVRRRSRKQVRKRG
jgi:membrane peptidoglycan carboxypeptidase